MKPWVEKHRPRRLEDVASQEDVTRALKSAVDSYEKACALPHLLFYGGAGTGKTTTAIALARELYGDNPEVLSMRMLELNASDDRGIHVVREKIKKFSQNAVQENACIAGTQKRQPPFKLIILDEADALLPDAQSALRRIIEDSSSSTRFILLCNYLSRIIDPIASRCVKYRFSSLPRKHILERLRLILEKETHQPAEKTDSPFQSFLLDMIYQKSQGDMRNAITLLQSAIQYRFPSMLTEEIMLTDDSERMVYDALGMIPVDVITEYVRNTWVSGNYPKMLDTTNKILLMGYSAMDVTQHILKYVVQVFQAEAFPKATSVQRSLIAQKISSVEKALMDGADDLLQLLNLNCYAQAALQLDM